MKQKLYVAAPMVSRRRLAHRWSHGVMGASVDNVIA
jgi:hypothetical protein